MDETCPGHLGNATPAKEVTKCWRPVTSGQGPGSMALVQSRACGEILAGWHWKGSMQNMETRAVKERTREPWKAFQARQRSMVVKREAVLRTAAHLFLEHGYQKSSMSMLAAQLKITKPALYYYFRNKEEILVECYRNGIAYIENLLKQTNANEGTGLRKLFMYVETYTEALVSYDFGRCVSMLDESELSPATRREVRTMKRRLDSTLRGYVEEGIADGSIRPCNPKLVSFAIAGAINWIGTWYHPGGDLSPREIAVEYAQILTGGLGTIPTERNGQSPRG
jgi:AcrR family transcriptional regulator